MMILLEDPSPVSTTLTLVISIGSLLCSFLVAYFANFKKAKPSLLVNSVINIYPLKINLTTETSIYGGSALLLPLTFFNWSPNGGNILDCRINLSHSDEKNTIYDIPWKEFHVLQANRNMVVEDLAHSITLPPNRSILKNILFYMSDQDKKLEIKSGKYDLNILVWNSESKKPNIKQSFSFQVSPIQSDYYLENVKNGTMGAFPVNIRETNVEAILTQKEAEEKYGL